jgi:predicted RNA-binding protein with PUA-like domain
MNYWLFKSEPFKWSWAQQVEAGENGTFWNGVRNHLAKQQLMAMQLGDLGFFYHSNEGKEIVGIVKVIKTYYPDPSDEKGIFGMVDIAAVRPLAKPFSLAQVKQTPELAEMALLKYTRLSVQNVRPNEWEFILKQGE